MDFTKINPGSFLMGSNDGEHDEKPVHKVNITYPFYMGVTPVTNLQYEEFDPSHRALRSKRGLSKQDDEPVIFINWYEAEEFCRWLSKKEGKPYRLPTEAEWEYACRAGTKTPYSTGDELPLNIHKNQQNTWDPEPVSLKVGTGENPWGLHDMHGIVEEWCYDWYGPYILKEDTDPVGYYDGDFKVTRGGSHNTDLFYLRSANRSGTLPEDKNWLIGFRVVQAPLPKTFKKRVWTSKVKQIKYDYPKSKVKLEHPIPYIKSAPFKHNHCPSITWCDNGDLLAIWFSCNKEAGREMTILSSRLNQGEKEWSNPVEFFNAPDRNMTGSSLFNDGEGKLYHFNGLEAAYGWGNLCLVMRKSDDNGVTWSKPKIINAEHQNRNQVISGTIKTKEGYLIQPCDAVPGHEGGTAIHITCDNGDTWYDPGAGKPSPVFEENKTGGWIAGIHAGVIQLADGSLMALGRGDSIDGKMPISLSGDLGQTWSYKPSIFPPIGSGQRLILMRLREGPILLISFTDPKQRVREGTMQGLKMSNMEKGYGMFAALSYDEGKTWPFKKLLTPGDIRTKLNGGGWTGEFTLDDSHSEPMGYLAATQSPEGTIQLISSSLHYRFDLSWLESS